MFFMNHSDRKFNIFLSLFENIFINKISALKEKRLEGQKNTFQKAFFRARLLSLDPSQ